MQIIAILAPLAVSIFAVVWASRASHRASAAEQEATRQRSLADTRYKVYQPMLEIFGDMMVPARAEAALKEAEKAIPDFQTFISVWGSDEAVAAFYRFRSGSNHQPPPMIAVRLVADFLVEARRDLAWPETKITPIEVMGMRMDKMSDELVAALTMDLEELGAKYEWKVPWKKSRR
ncbi:hypothetical protein MN032_15690 [Agromyces atrinae]|uniref:hypothetical protein n=1 Tax=Agromyces atrinae TaxID=592376 RepID=UPI001F5A4187|nr:hypothetical protein [Agromyces atrinae]MCI2959133.1 hypothetical protein [Agromyces atrinae]